MTSDRQQGDKQTLLTAAEREEVRSKALALGFDVCRFTEAVLPPDHGDHLAAFIEEGRHGDMAWLADRQAQRSQPKALWPEAVSVISVGLNYGPTHDPMAMLGAKDRGVISVYAQNEDYHDVLKKKLKSLGRWMAERFDAPLKVFVDTAPVMEKPLAQQAGVGWQGKHTNLVSTDYGSWLFLGALYTPLQIEPDAPKRDQCGTCRACIDICPTQAITAPYQIDARACISYLTIEHKGPIPHRYRQAMGNRIYGCDDCLAVCPWNKFAQDAREAKLVARDELVAPTLVSLAALDDAGFRQHFRKSPIKRIGRDLFIRNVMIAIGNSGNPDLLSAIEPRLIDDAPAVRAMAVWAWRQLGGEEDFLASTMANETHEWVSAELAKTSH